MGPFSNFLTFSSSANWVSNHYSVIKMAPYTKTKRCPEHVSH